MMLLPNEHFKYEVSVPCPLDGTEIMRWLNKNNIRYVYTTYNAGTSIEYFMTKEEHAIWFKLRWT